MNSMPQYHDKCCVAGQVCACMEDVGKEMSQQHA